LFAPTEQLIENVFCGELVTEQVVKDVTVTETGYVIINAKPAGILLSVL